MKDANNRGNALPRHIIEKKRKEQVTPIGVKVGVLRHQPQDLPL